MIYHALVQSHHQPDPWQTPRHDSRDDAAGTTAASNADQPSTLQTLTSPHRPIRIAIAWCLIVLCTIAIMVMQQKASKMPPAPPADASPGLDMVLIGRLAIGFEQVLNHTDAQMLLTLEQQAAQSPFSTTDRLRLAIVTAELQGAEAAAKRLDPLSDKQLNATLEPAADFQSDRRLLKRIYSDQAYVPTKAEAQQLIARHGWFGELAAGYNLPTNNALFKEPRQAAANTIYLIFGFGLIVILAALAGFGLMVTGIIAAAIGKLRAKFKPGPLSHHSAYLEMVALFLVTFIALQLLAMWLSPQIGIDLMLPMLALMAVPLLWPLLCGINKSQYRLDMGLTAPRGLFREIGAGVLGYLAGLPLIFVGAIVTILVAILTGMNSEHPAGRELMTGGPYEIVVLILATIVWAPLVEEMVFRAAFYRHMRKWPGWATWLAATIVTSLIFAAIHPQGIVGIPILMSIAFVLAGLRQWRGSLVAPIAAHAMHNGTIITMTLLLLYM